MQRETAVNRAKTPASWNDINWCRNRKLVRNLRQRIYRASRQGDHKKLRSLQRLMLKSRANREISIRQVTQINKGSADCWRGQAGGENAGRQNKVGGRNQSVPTLDG